MHKNGIFHRDIKPYFYIRKKFRENILLIDDTIKLADFGVSNQFGSKMRKKKEEDEFLEGNAGSDCYFCPEACGANKYSGKMADLWACAVTLYQMAFLKLPFNAKNRQSLYAIIKSTEPKLIKEDLAFDCEEPELLLDLLEQMFRKQSSLRITMN